jgi:hypothetical protein
MRRTVPRRKTDPTPRDIDYDLSMPGETLPEEEYGSYLHRGCSPGGQGGTCISLDWRIDQPFIHEGRREL